MSRELYSLLIKGHPLPKTHSAENKDDIIDSIMPRSHTIAPPTLFSLFFFMLKNELKEMYRFREY